MLRKCVCALSVFVISWLPLLLAWAALGVLIYSRHFGVAAAPTPNPDPAPWYFLGPADLLVYIEPRFAGTIRVWWWFWISTIVVFTLTSAYLVGPNGQRQPTSGLRRFRMLFLISVMLGIVFASPWLYSLLAFKTSSTITDV